MKTGKLNLIVGAVGLLVASLGGMALGMTFNDLFKEGHYQIELVRSFLKAGHTHGQPFAMYNLIFAILIGKVALSDRSKKIASWAAALAMLFPVGMVLRGVTDGAFTFSPVAMFGGVCLMVSAGFLVAGSRGWGDSSE